MPAKSRKAQTVANWIPAAAGWLAALLLIGWLRPYPPRVTTLQAVFFLYLTALVEVGLVAAIAAIVSLATWWLVKLAGMRPAPPRLTWGIASRAVWVVPLFIFGRLNSLWAVVVTVMAVLGVVFVLRNLQPAVKQTSALSSTLRMFGCVIGAAAIELGFVAFGAGRMGQALLLFGVAAVIVTWEATTAGRHGHPARGLITMFMAVVFSSGALVWRAGIQPGDGFLGLPVDPAIAASLYTLQKTFGGAGGRPVPFVPNRREAARNAGTEVKVAGTAHLGIYLWPEVKKEATLVPPLPDLGRVAFGKDHRTPLTIPFYGAYWFFRPPFQQPPFGSLVVYGSPAVKQFISNDNSPLWEEAHQNLQTSFDLSCCSRIEIDVTNADQRPEFLEIELALVDSSFKRGRIVESLGRKKLVSQPAKVALPETLAYTIPPKSKLTKMDELIVRFRLVTPRWSESAQVAIERFRLIPRGMR